MSPAQIAHRDNRYHKQADKQGSSPPAVRGGFIGCHRRTSRRHGTGLRAYVTHRPRSDSPTQRIKKKARPINNTLYANGTAGTTISLMTRAPDGGVIDHLQSKHTSRPCTRDPRL